MNAKDVGSCSDLVLCDVRPSARRVQQCAESKQTRHHILDGLLGPRETQELNADACNNARDIRAIYRLKEVQMSHIDNLPKRRCNLSFTRSSVFLAGAEVTTGPVRGALLPSAESSAEPKPVLLSHRVSACRTDAQELR